MIALAIALLALAGAAHAVPAQVERGFVAATGGAITPPDVQGAVGDAHVAIMLNGRWAVFDKQSGAPLVSASLADFWSAAGVASPNGPFDPRLLYDASSRRWFATAANAAFLPNQILLAVSNGEDPTGGWTGFAIDADASDQTWADFPMLGVDDEGVYVAVPMYAFADDDQVAAVDVLVVPKLDLVGPAPSVAGGTIFQLLAPSAVGPVPQPVVALDGGGLPLPLVSGVAATPGAISIAHVAGTIDAPSVSPLATIAVDAYEPPPRAAQPGPKAALETSFGDLRSTASVVRRGGSLWAVQGVALGARAAVRWLELDAATGALRQEGVLSDPELHLFFPSIAVNEHEQVVVGMSGSSASTFASAFAAVGERVGEAIEFGPLLLVREGLADYERVRGGRNRWGDYSATVVDPADARTFWTFQEFVAATDVWGVAAAAIRVPEPHAAALALVSALALGALRRVRCAR
ncbi:MAG: hypothetical protein DCC71_03200 [Proteobacteria bacterium]|nr:MAG: hypothetical protein DCC71_03200 [Pseudomonadota bacterium]